MRIYSVILILIFVMAFSSLPKATLGSDEALSGLKDGIALYREGKYNDSLAQLERTLEANPRLAEAHLYKGNCYANKEDFEKAIREYGLAIEAKPGYSLAYYNRAVARYSKQDYAGAWQDIRVAQSLGYDPHPVFLEQLKEDSGKGE